MRPLPNLQSYTYPSTPKEAVRILAETPGSRPLAGGTALALSRDGSVRVLVDLHRTGMDRIEAGSGLELGATVRVRALQHHPAVRSYAGGVVSDAAGHIGNALVRNAVTVGGNAVGLFPWSDLPPVFIALDARFCVLYPDGEVSMGPAEFYAAHPTKRLGGGLLTSVVLPPGWTGAYETFRLTATDYALATVVVGLRVEGGSVSDCRVVASGCTPMPVRLTEAERAVAEGDLPEEVDRLVAGLKLRPDDRAGEGYRRRLTAVLLRRAIGRATALAKGVPS